MDNSTYLTAGEFLLTVCERDLIKAIRDYWEEENWKKIVHHIVESQNADLRYSDTLKRSKLYAATKTFQGIRIFINNELGSIERALPLMFDRAGVRLV